MGISKTFSIIVTFLYLSVILIGVLSAYLLLVNFRSRMVEKHSALRTQKDARDPEVESRSTSFMAPRAQNVTCKQEAK